MTNAIDLDRLRADLDRAEAERDREYWLFTRCANAPPVSRETSVAYWTAHKAYWDAVRSERQPQGGG